jgi:hypothetical protein
VFWELKRKGTKGQHLIAGGVPCSTDLWRRGVIGLGQAVARDIGQLLVSMKTTTSRNPPVGHAFWALAISVFKAFVWRILRTGLTCWENWLY